VVNTSFFTTRSDSSLYYALQQNHCIETINLRDKMHLRKSVETICSGGRSDFDTKNDTNGTSKSSTQNYTNTNGITKYQIRAEIPLEEQELDVLVDVVLGSWIMLAQRFRWDSRHHCTWETKHAGEEIVQYIEAEHLDLLKLETVDELLAKVRTARSKEISVSLNEPPILFLKDGTMDEVIYKPDIPDTRTLTDIKSGLSLSMSKPRCEGYASLLNGNLLRWHSTKQKCNYTPTCPF
jgi:hypothetical protein